MSCLPLSGPVSLIDRPALAYGWDWARYWDALLRADPVHSSLDEPAG